MDLETYLDGAKALLRQNGGRVTASRLETLRAIFLAEKPVNASEIEQRLSERLTKAVDTATVFRILNAFSDLGLIHRIEEVSAYIPCKHFGCTHGFHVVLNCANCGRYQEVELPEEIFTNSRDYCATHFGFALSDTHVQLEGVCKDCQPVVHK